MTGTPSQIEWAERIRRQVIVEFDRVARALESAAARQGELDQADTKALIAVLREKQAEVLANDRAGYFIHDWQEVSDQVRQMIARDSRYQAIRTERDARRAAA